MRYILIIFLLLITSCEAENSSTSEIYPNKYPGLKTYVIKTDGKEKVTHALHPDLPLIGGWGDDTYKFNGKILYDNKSVSLEIEKYFPLCVIEYKEKEYFIGCFYFVPERYQVYQIDKDSLQLLDPNDIPVEITFAELPDKYYTKSFKVWYMLEMLKRKDVDYVLDVFENYLDFNERAFLLGNSKEFNEVKESNRKVRALSLKSASITDVFHEIRAPYSKEKQKTIPREIDESSQQRMFNIAMRICKASTPFDLFQEIPWLYGYDGKQVERELAKKVMKEHVTEDFINQVPDSYTQELYRSRILLISAEK